MKYLLLFIYLSVPLFSKAQADKNIWKDLDSIKTENYELKFPISFRHIPNTGMGNKGPEQFFEASGGAFPGTYNKGPVIVTIFITSQYGSSLEECKTNCLEGYRQNKDREFPLNYVDKEEKFNLLSGQEAYILSTHFYRRSNQLNQSRFDLVSFSDKTKIGYLYTVSIQYSDKDYQFETDYKPGEFSKKLYTFFKLK